MTMTTDENSHVDEWRKVKHYFWNLDSKFNFTSQSHGFHHESIHCRSITLHVHVECFWILTSTEYFFPCKLIGLRRLIGHLRTSDLFVRVTITMTKTFVNENFCVFVNVTKSLTKIRHFSLTWRWRKLRILTITMTKIKYFSHNDDDENWNADEREKFYN